MPENAGVLQEMPVPTHMESFHQDKLKEMDKQLEEIKENKTT
jgi:hypothetical protein